MANYQQALNLFSDPQHLALLARLQRGIEKEGLRCSPQGIISQKPHPKGLGSALTHPSITTDYSEALLEFITPVFESAHEAHAYLSIAHRYAYKQLDGELIWPSSMPCILQGEMSIPIAHYGSSNLGQLKHVYRHGLWHRYGRTMQTISGIHYNFSLPAEIWPLLQANDERGDQYSPQSYISARYFGLIRNFRRYSWLLMYLFGASPAVCASFLAGRDHKLDRLNEHSLYAPYATSLRMSDLGYQNNAQSDLMVCHNTVDSYIKTLGKAISAPVQAYEEIGLQDEHGHYKQLNTNLLQIENEYYSDIRPKRVARNGEKPLQALDKYGVEYIEVRCTDVNPFMPLGIDVPQMQFMDLFLTWCLLQPSPDIDEDEYWRIKRNQQKTVMEGRRPGLMLEQGGSDISLQQWGMTILDEMKELAIMMDRASGETFHIDTLGQQRLKLADSRLTPSAQVLLQLQESSLEFAELTLQQAERHRKTLSENLGPQVYQQWQQMARDSLAAQEELEQSDNMPFAEYLAHYLQR
ncbi:glutamate--cysteine ligase [Thalassolituus alkanivorans]|uniref:glutamate--cysteine ligase n=1 Tax=Thalassolituus alkanivorans TaxID=2881055 RepID=UPI001E3B659F|nr:glutamate--cysteine ligase [Thalassolituus alkanivorans]MCB2387675.1 glutamate--cysteine ligase [Thalassolituus alkanivorans]MCB2424923.1 glutamate--cysteine ligase [Thalassolituus alkanivorans]